MWRTPRRLAATAVLALFALTLAAAPAAAAVPREEVPAGARLGGPTPWSGLVSWFLARLGLAGAGPAPTPETLTAASGHGMDPDGTPEAEGDPDLSAQGGHGMDPDG